MIGTAKSPIIIELISQEEVLRRIAPDIVILLEAGVFDFKGGSVTIHRDGEGHLQLIVPNWPVYRAPHR